MSRSLLTGIIITFLLFASLAVFFYYSYIRVKGIPAVDAVPNDAVIIIGMKNATKSWIDLQNTDMWKDLRKNDAISRLSSAIANADSLINAIEELREAVAENKSVISFHVQGAQSVNMLFVLETSGKLDPRKVLDQIASSSHYTVSSHTFEKEKVYDLLNESKFPVMSFAYLNELLVCSTEGALVEESLRKMKYKLPNLTKGFDQARNMAEVGGELSVFVNYQFFPGLMKIFTRDEHAGLFAYLQAFANWSMFDVKMAGEELNISGISYTDDSLFQFLDLFKTQVPQEFTFGKYLPRNTALFTHLSFSDYGRFNTDLNEYLQNRGKLDAYIKFADSLENRYGIELNEKLLPLVGEEAALGMLEATSSDFEQKLFAMVHFRDARAAASVFAGYLNAFEKRGEKDSVSFTYNGYAIERLRLGNFLKLYYGGVMEKIQSPCFTLIGDVFVFANDPSTIKTIIDQFVSANVLERDDAYKQFQQKTAGAANITFFFNPTRCFMLPEAFVNDEFFSALNRYQYDFKKFEFVSVQYANTNNNAFFTNVNVKFNPSFKEETKMLWALKLDTTFDVQPAIVYNPSTGQNCILVQDAGNMLYYISNSGSIIWKARIQGRMLGPVLTVDPMRTGQVRYLFNTATQAYLIDEKGVSQGGYPVKFPGNATATLTLADIKGDSSLSFFVPLANNRVMGYQLNSKPLPGWNPKAVEERIISPLRPFRLGRAVYLYGTGQDGHILIYTAKGERIKATSPVVAMKGLQFYQTTSDTMRIEWTTIDTLGKTRFFATDSSFVFADVSSGAAPLLPSYMIKNEGTDDAYIAGNAGGWVVADRHLKKLFSHAVNDTAAMMPFFTDLASGREMVGWTDRTAGKIYLYDTKGGLYPAFPLEGVSAFTTGNLMLDGNNYLITGDRESNVKLFRLK